MEADDLSAKLAQIEEQTNHLIAEPKTLTSERLLMILALVRQIRASLRSGSTPAIPPSGDVDATIPV